MIWIISCFSFSLLLFLLINIFHSFSSLFALLHLILTIQRRISFNEMTLFVWRDEMVKCRERNQRKRQTKKKGNKLNIGLVSTYSILKLEHFRILSSFPTIPFYSSFHPLFASFPFPSTFIFQLYRSFLSLGRCILPFLSFYFVTFSFSSQFNWPFFFFLSLSFFKLLLLLQWIFHHSLSMPPISKHLTLVLQNGSCKVRSFLPFFFFFPSVNLPSRLLFYQS